MARELEVFNITVRMFWSVARHEPKYIHLHDQLM